MISQGFATTLKEDIAHNLSDGDILLPEGNTYLTYNGAYVIDADGKFVIQS